MQKSYRWLLLPVFMFSFSGFLTFLGGIIGHPPMIVGGLILISVGVLIFRSYNKKKLEIEKEEKRKKEMDLKEVKDRKNEINSNLERVRKIQTQINDGSKISVPSISEFKKFISDNETVIQQKGGEKQLFDFLKLDSFLNDFRTQIVRDIEGLKNLEILNDLERQIILHSKRDSLDKSIENLNDFQNRLEGKEGTGFDSQLKKLSKLGDNVTPTLKRQIDTLQFYVSMSMFMLEFYISDKKIRYFEIYSSFEKLGVFDSTFQKNVMGKLESIDLRLSNISNQLTTLNNSFQVLVDSSESIISELKGIKEGIDTSHMLQWINIYQSYKINKNTKGLR